VWHPEAVYDAVTLGEAEKDTVTLPDTLCVRDAVKLELRVGLEGVGGREGQEAVTEVVGVPPPPPWEAVKDTVELRLWVREAQYVALRVAPQMEGEEVWLTDPEEVEHTHWVGVRVEDMDRDGEVVAVDFRVTEWDTEAVMVSVGVRVVQGELVTVPERVKVRDRGGLPLLDPQIVVDGVKEGLPLPQLVSLGLGVGEMVLVWVPEPLPPPGEGELQGLSVPLPVELKLASPPDGLAVGHTLTVKDRACWDPTGVEWEWEVGATVTAVFAIKDHIGR